MTNIIQFLKATFCDTSRHTYRIRVVHVRAIQGDAAEELRPGYALYYPEVKFWFCPLGWWSAFYGKVCNPPYLVTEAQARQAIVDYRYNKPDTIIKVP